MPAASYLKLTSVLVFATDFCNTEITSIDPNGFTDYYNYWNVPLTFDLPDVAIYPEFCFRVLDMQFLDANGVDMIADGRIVLDWINWDATYFYGTSCDAEVTIFSTYNTPTVFRDSGITMYFDSLCHHVNIEP